MTLPAVFRLILSTQNIITLKSGATSVLQQCVYNEGKNLQYIQNILTMYDQDTLIVCNLIPTYLFYILSVFARP